MPNQGYVRFPTISQDKIVFVAEDDLWLVSSEGGRAERLTAGVGEVRFPRFSPDGTLLAFVGEDEGPDEIYVMPSEGDVARRLTFQGASCRVVGWSPDGDAILYASNTGQSLWGQEYIYALSPQGGQPRKLPVGQANAISYEPRGGVVIGRNIGEPARWKRYRGGTAGHLWCDVEGNGIFQRLLRLDGNIAAPCWVGERIYFISDHEGIGNIYSCTPLGEDLRRHTEHQDFYARNLSSDGQRMVYHAGADLYLFDPDESRSHHLQVTLPGSRSQRNRKFVYAGRNLHSTALHPQGYALALTTRGKAFSFGNWEGPVLQHGAPDGVRYRLLEWLNDGKRLVAISDEIGPEALVVFNPEDASEPQVYNDIEFGRAVDLLVSPTDDKVAITNHRNELVVVDLETSSARVLDRSDYDRIQGAAWSPDGRWLAYGFTGERRKTAIKLCNVESGETFMATDPILKDCAPAFDPEGKYLYFLGERILNPVADNLHFEWSFPRGVKPYAIMLQRDLKSPFIPEPKAPGDKEKEKEKEKEQSKEEETEKTDANAGDADKEQDDAQKEETDDNRPTPIVIDLEGITRRVVPFPVSEGLYTRILGIKGKALYLSFPIEGTINQSLGGGHEPKGRIDSFEFETQKQEFLMDGVSRFGLSRDAKTLLYRSHSRLRVLKAGDKAPRGDNSERNSRETGWIDLGRVKVSVQPAAEWKQMFAEAWRLQREQFWTEDMAGVDWDKIYAQYAPLVERVSSRGELSDLFWELQGELGTSHAYEGGGEYRPSPHYQQGYLGVDWNYDEEKQRYRIAHIVWGDPSDSKATSPLTSPGLNIAEGDAVLAINSQRVTPEHGPAELLVNQANNEVQLTIESAANGDTRVVTVKALGSEMNARYREWVDQNSRYVHEQSQGRVGYIHIPDMGYRGFAEFHRSYLAEYDYPGLLIDVRHNGGGMVSGLLLEKLARRRIGYDFARWSQPEPYPAESPRGPMVALTDEHSGSDGDIFSHSFKLMKLGPLVGKRTWGGVIGINPRHQLVDGTTTTQPEAAFWFKDVGWNVENYGTDPDIEVDIAPQDFVNDIDPQLDRAIAEALRMIEETPALEPNAGERPRKGRVDFTRS
ncbi:MAG TPA: PDZ domain-containing protein [Ktedonobacteraceae bacterium]|nr:PDZ domain-containing protein [Ktedonobacteraceae bacterium]